MNTEDTDKTGGHGKGKNMLSFEILGRDHEWICSFVSVSSGLFRVLRVSGFSLEVTT